MGIAVRRCHSIFVHRRVGFLEIEPSEPLHISISDNAVGMCTNHDIGVGGVGPLGHPATFIVHLQERGNHVGYSLRLDQ